MGVQGFFCAVCRAISVCLVFSMSASFYAHAFIYEVTLLKKWDGARGRYQKVFMYSDFHDRPTTVSQQAHREQHVEFDKILFSLDRRNSKILVEDLCSQNDVGCFSCGAFAVTPNGGMLGGLTKKCQDAGVSVCNVEFRFCRVTAFAPVFNASPSHDPTAFHSTRSLKIGAVRDEIMRVLQEVRSYRDGRLLSSWYEQGVRVVEQGVKDFSLSQAGSLSVAAYVSRYMPPTQRIGRLKQLLTFDSELLDHKLVHQIVTAGDTETIIIVAGGSHCANVSAMLQKIGYTKVRSFPERQTYTGVGVPAPLNLALALSYKNF